MQQIIIGREYPDIITNLVKNSEHSIKIMMFAWMWYDGQVGERVQKFSHEILAASRRGVDVSAFIKHGSICERVRASGIKIKRVDSSRTMHIKMIIVDDKYLVLGSHNLTKRAFEINHEISFLTDDVASISRCVSFFNTF